MLTCLPDLLCALRTEYGARSGERNVHFIKVTQCQGTRQEVVPGAVELDGWSSASAEPSGTLRLSIHTASKIELANAIFEYLEIFHNRQRRHSALGWLTPIEYEKIHTTSDVA